MKKIKKLFALLLMPVIFLVMGLYVVNKSDLVQSVQADEYGDSENNDKDKDKDKDDDYDKDKKDDYDKDDKYDNYDKKKDSHDDYKKKDEYDEYKIEIQNGVKVKVKINDDEYDKDEYVEFDDYDAYDEYDEYIGETATSETIVNDDGTITKRITKTDGDEIKIIEVTYDADGNRIMEKKMEQKQGKEEVKITTFDVYGNKLGEYEFKTKDGKKIKIQIEEGTQGKLKIKYDAKNQALVVKTSGVAGNNGSNELKIRARGDLFTITRAGYNVDASFPMTINESTGQILIETSAGNVELKAMPDTIIKTIKGRKQLDIVSSVNLSDEKGLSYQVSGTKFEKFLGIFTVSIPATVSYDAQTGQFEKQTQPFFSKVLDLFSI